MTKRIVILCAMLCCAFSFARAQETGNAGGSANFFSDVDYTVSVGIGTYSSSDPYDGRKMALIFGIEAKKPIKSYLDDKLDVYGLVGLHLGSKGGKTEEGINEDVTDLFAADKFKNRHLMIPVRAGARYDIGKMQAFADLGPYIGFAIKKKHSEYVNPKGFTAGLGWNLGLRFWKKFGISLGMEHPFMNLGECTISDELNNPGYMEDGDIVELKAKSTFNIRFQWTFEDWKFGKKKNKKA